MMKFSVLLPTRNRLDLLSYAIETVRRQDYSDWEVIISDNFSDEDILDYVQSLNEPRIKCFRTEEFIPVTENWNNALEKSNGDYIIMLGDDDCLMQGYFSTMIKIIEKYDAPDLIYTSAFLYAYPGVMPGFPDGFLRTYNHRKIFRSAHKPFWMEKSESRMLANHSLNFRMHFDYNMQFSLVSRKLIHEMAKYGAFYQSPYPDYYASNAMMLKAERILIVPQPLVTIGISPKSFGFYYFNDSEGIGNEFLKNLPIPSMAHRLKRVILPGTGMNTSWLVSMETLAQNFRGECNVRVNYNRYRFLQICAVYAGLVLGKGGAKVAVKNVRSKMNILERILYDVPFTGILMITSIVPKRYRTLIAKLLIYITGSHPRQVSKKIEGKFITILDVFEAIASKTSLAKKA